MAYKSKFTGAEVDALLEKVDGWVNTPSTMYDELTGQEIIDKINSVAGNIVFTKYVDCQAGAGKSTN